MGKTKITFTLLTIMCTFLYSCKYKEYKNKQLSSYIDSTLQVKATSILENKLSELNALSGQAIVMEAQTGNIKAMVGLERKDSADYQSCENFSLAYESALMLLVPEIHLQPLKSHRVIYLPIKWKYYLHEFLLYL